MLNKNLSNFHSKKLRIVACIQARMGSKRLKRKALLKISNRTLTENISRRLKTAREIDDIVLATSLKKENDILIKHAQDIGLKYYRGSEEDLVSRLYETAQKFKADALVRICGCCPLVDPELVDKAVKIYRKNYQNIDFLTNCFPPTFPDGLDIDILPFSTLKKIHTEVKKPLYREWFPSYIMENPKKFRIYNLKNSLNLSSIRWTVDYPEDLVLIRKIFKALDRKNRIFSMKDVLNFLKKNPQISKINEKRIDMVIVRNIRSREYHSKI